MKFNRSAVESLRIYSEGVVDSLDLVYEEGWNEDVKDVIVILSASHSGSSLVYNALSSSVNIVSPAGEHEPWLFLSENKHPFTESDKVEVLQNKRLLLRLIRNDLLVRTDEVASPEYLLLLRNRMKIRGRNLPRHIEEEILVDSVVDRVLHQHIQKRGFGFEDSLRAPTSERQIADQQHCYPIENPPHIDVPLARLVRSDELSTKTLLFKSPSDSYRPGMYEQLFPNADIKYVHLTRGYAQTINGIMDGWLAGQNAFISNGVGLVGQELDIAGYTEDEQTSAYWCFDLFPGWEAFRSADLLTIGALQWIRAHSAILTDFNPGARVQFEGLYADRGNFVAELEAATGIETAASIWDVPVMTTHKPRQARWKSRAGIFNRLDELVSADLISELKDINNELGYSEDPSTWL